MVSEDFKVGDPVWAKMKGYPPWPAKVTSAPSDAKAPKNKKAHYVYFFGTKNFAWILDEHISLHSESMLNTMSKKKTTSYQSAIDAFVSYLKTKKKIKQSPLKMKREKIENNDKKSLTKVVKVVNSVSKKHERQVLSNKSRVRKEYKKRSSDDINGGSSKYSSKFRKLKDYTIDHFCPKSSVPHRPPSSHRNVSIAEKHVTPSHLKFGFIGLGLMGKHIVYSLLESGHNVSVWNKTSSQCETFQSIGARKARSPAELIVDCNITFCCVADPEASKSIIFAEQGILKGLEQAEKLGLGRRGYVEMTNIDPETSLGICEAITMKRGAYLEAPLCGTSDNAQTGSLLVLCAGDRQLFKDCETCFHAISNHVYYITCDVGVGTKLSLILSMLSGTVCAALAEVISLVDRYKLQKEDFLTCLEEGPLNSPDIIEKTKMMFEARTSNTVTALKHIQKDMGLSLLMANSLCQRMPVTAAANEVYKYAKLRKLSNDDMSAVFRATRF